MREGRRIKQVLLLARLPDHPTGNGLDGAIPPALDVVRITALARLRCVEPQGHPIFRRPSGTGKPYVAVARAAGRWGFSIGVIRLDDLVQPLKTAEPRHPWQHKLKTSLHPALSAIDGVGHLPLNLVVVNDLFP